ncbi:hypothetical protein B9G53_09845 [Pseudanabaena sp. SR411]|uniref:type II toxin-antitoxin system RelE/ParE family toxin n=1 Tax=Pseudanabaena sp. SR411 TaxID=1980935 RepID=UPI000B986B9E|nr:type II toxin-antitoxin system RelE/ParE family toxin [Pseudanabaena sp. SR411]OYQ64844.1 hypothetical protein B9G53_09845 [Pseudanabaena sp. SR411]
MPRLSSHEQKRKLRISGAVCDENRTYGSNREGLGIIPYLDSTSELRIDYGAGYRVYFIQRGTQLIILLAGGDKRTQDQDIKTALNLSKEL